MYFIIRLVGRGDTARSMTALLFVFGSATYVITNLYWLTHLLVKEGETPQFSVAEIGIAGVFLLYGAALSVVYKKTGGEITLASGDSGFRENESGEEKGIDGSMDPSHKDGTVLIMAAAAAFVAANTAFWYGWNGGWVRDLITGLAMAYFFAVIIRGLYDTNSMIKREWIIAGILTLPLLCLEAASIFATGEQVLPIEIGRYAFWTAGLGFLVIKMCIVFRSIRRGDESRERAASAIYLSFAVMIWIVFIMYLSTGATYELTEGLLAIAMLPMYQSVRKGVQQA